MIDETIAKKVKGIVEESIKEGKNAADAENIAIWKTDKEFYRSVLYILGAAVILATLGGLGLSAFDKDIPQFIVAIGTTALGGVAGILAPAPTNK